jgi:hypothetical protein
MKKICSLLAIAALSAGSAFAGCGKIDTTEGTLKSFDAETKVAMVETKSGESKRLTLTPDTKGGKKADKLVGKAVKVLSSHGKVTEIDKA